MAAGWRGGPDGFRVHADRDVAPYNYRLERDGDTFGANIPIAARYPELILRPRRH